MLLAAIRRGDRGEARRIINYVLVHIYSAGEERSDLLKGLLLELVVMISRAAVEAGAAQSEVLGLNFRFLTELAEINDDEDLAAWLRKTLEHVMSTIERQEDFTPPLLVSKALDFMRKNLHRDISRDETARHAGISPSHFSRLLKGAYGPVLHRIAAAMPRGSRLRFAEHHRRIAGRDCGRLRILRPELFHPRLPGREGRNAKTFSQSGPVERQLVRHPDSPDHTAHGGEVIWRCAAAAAEDAHAGRASRRLAVARICSGVAS